ncbi:MAG: 6-phosphofructokinase [Propionibacteriaceae bacterium]|nr:6-phosphofructokinase [Propionibacteriaceae bacterium]
MESVTNSTPPITPNNPIRVGVLTSGGDAQGMNAALRAVVRTALSVGARPYLIREGYQGMIDGGDDIELAEWKHVSGILNRGGTTIGTFRSKQFTTREGMLTAAENLVDRGIDRLIVIGGDGSLSGLDQFSHDWPSLLDELVSQGRISQDQRQAHPRLVYAGLVGSIDNDLVGTDMTIGVDSALHRIQDAIDAIASTAASHQRCFVVEVMGRRCGYLALAAAISGGCDYVLIPELPPEDGWEQTMCAQLGQSREAGRKDSIVIIAEGATTRSGDAISADYVATTISAALGEEARVTILGHVQRGGTPSAYDRWASTWLGYEATQHVLSSPTDEGLVFGFHGEQIVTIPLVQAVEQTRRVPALISQGKYGEAMDLRGREFHGLMRIFDELSNPTRTTAAPDGARIGVMHAGGLAPGMNTAAKTAVRLGISRGHTIVGVDDGFPGLAEGKVRELTWKEVDTWSQEGGAMLETRRHIPTEAELTSIAWALKENKIKALIVIGGWDAYAAVHLMNKERRRYAEFDIPVMCVPASIDNNLPGTAMSIGADAALNVVVDSIDKVKMSASASQRCFFIETMGRRCGYLALMGGFASGAEQVYLNETGITLDKLKSDIDWLRRSVLDHERSLFLAVRNEYANPNYTTDVIRSLFDEEGKNLRGPGKDGYDTRTLVIGHVQQGSSPTPADRLLATRLTDAALTHIREQLTSGDTTMNCVGSIQNEIRFATIDDVMGQVDDQAQRPKQQWWLGLKQILDCVNRESVDEEARESADEEARQSGDSANPRAVG